MASTESRDDLSKLIEFGKKIDNLISGVTKNVNSASATPDFPSLSPADSETVQCTIKELREALDSADQLTLVTIAETLKMRSNRVLLKFPPLQKYPVVKCPDIDHIKIALMKESYFVTVHHIEGYNYSVEYAHIYRARSEKSFFPLDVFSVCQRALLSFDPFLSKDLIAEYAEFMVRTSFWEFLKIKTISEQAVHEALPELLAGANEPSYGGTRIYVGQSPHGIFFIIRSSCSLKSLSDNTGAERDEEIEASSKYTFVTYKKYDLSRATLDATEEVMDFADSESSVKTGDAKESTNSASGDPSDLYLSVVAERDSTPETPVGHEEEDAFDDVNLRPEKNINLQKKKIGKLMSTNYPRFNNCTVRQASPCSELMVWGQNNFLGTGTREETIADPWPMARPLSLCLEMVRMVACSARHTLVLTALGLVYSCGDNTEGALGTGDITSRHNLQVVSQWMIVPSQAENADNLSNAPSPDKPTELVLAENPPTIVKIAAGAGVIGSHSVALDEHGNLYSWGVAQATGLGVMKPVLSPRQLDTFPIPQSAKQGDPAEMVRAEVDAGTYYYRRGVRAVSDVSCGSGFSACVLRDSGEVCCWGVWQHGRLGRPIPIIQTATGRRRLFRSTKSSVDGKKTYARYQLRPLLVPGIHNASSVACGEAHTLCLTKEGHILAWGQNSCGQLGTGVTRSGFLRDNYRPTYVPPFCPATVNPANISPDIVQSYGRVATLVACGTFHSAVIEDGGAVWTWGGRGHPCIGHDDAPLTGPWSKRIEIIFGAALNTTKIMIPFELLPWCRLWSVPRRLDSLAGNKIQDGAIMKSTRIVQVACGDMHSAFLSATGIVFLCGDGPAVPPFVPPSPAEEENEFDTENEGETKSVDNIPQGEIKREDAESPAISPKSSASRDKISMTGKDGSSTRVKDDLDKQPMDTSAGEQKIEIPESAREVHTPRCPTSLWLPRLAARRTLLIAAAGTHMFALQDDDMVASSMSKKIFLNLQSEQEQLQYAEDVGGRIVSGPGSGGSVVELDDDEGDFTDMSISGDVSSANRSQSSIYEQRGCADCMLISSGKISLAHRAVLAARSPVLRDKLIEEVPGGDDLNQPTQILLPELLHGTARVLVQFLYTDTIPSRLLATPSMLRNLSRAAVQLKIPRLQIMCHQLLQLHSGVTKNRDISENEVELTSRTAGVGLEVIPPTLARDFGSVVGDAQYADIRFIAEGRTFPAHRFILEARSPYFRSMFRSGMMESFVVNGKPTDIVVPDRYSCLLRMLLYIYTDILPEGTHSALLEDLITADRYHITDMRLLCENMLIPTKENWMELLQVADAINSVRLKNETICFLRNHLGDTLKDRHSLEKSFEQFPDVLETILKMRQVAYPTPPSKILVDQVIANVKLNQEKSTIEIPWVGISLLVISGYIYTQLIRSKSLGPMIPFINMFMIAGLFFFAYKRVLSA